MKSRHSHSLFCNGRKGLTLVELVVVIAVIAVLAVVMLSALGKSRDSANRAVCLSNLRQITMGYLLLINDGNGSVSSFNGGSGGEQRIYANQLFTKGFVDSKKLFFSPFYKDTSDIDFWYWYISYGLNVEDPGWSGDGSTKRINYLDEDSARYPLFATTLWPNDDVPERGIFRMRYKPDTGNVNLVAGGRAHVGFLDGSVRSLLPDELARVGIRSGYQWGREKILFSE